MKNGLSDREYGCFKRCMEKYSIDPEFRRIMDDCADEAVSTAGFAGLLDGKAVKVAIRRILFNAGDAAGNPYFMAFAEINSAAGGVAVSDHKRNSFAGDRMFFYMDTQRNRCRMESAVIRDHPYIFYYPFSFELSGGCSVQCPFCGFAADRFRGSFRYTYENARLFREVVSAAFETAGKITASCPCYFATEPFDNPDYEKFLLEFKRITGEYPQTTTAVADRDPRRTEALINMLGEENLRKRASLRFSVRTVSQFNRITESFSPEKLAYVEILANNPESVNCLSGSGRAVTDGIPKERKIRYSICCVAGMKVNLFDRTVEFIEPELPDKTNPLGYRVLEKRGFADGAEFRQICEELTEKYTCGILTDDLQLCINRNVTVEKTAERFIFAGDGFRYAVAWGAQEHFGEAFREALEKLEKGADCGDPLTFAELVSGQHSREEERKLKAAFGSLFQRGYIRPCFRGRRTDG